MTEYFEKKSLFNFLKDEFKEIKGLEKISSFFEVLFVGSINYSIKKDWIKKFKIIRNNIKEFYDNVEIDSTGSKPNFIQKFKNYHENIISFDFNKTHLILTEKSLYFFPFKTQSGAKFIPRELERPFKIDLTNAPYNRYSEFNNIKLIDSEFKDGKTILTLKIEELDYVTQLILNKEITIANNN